MTEKRCGGCGLPAHRYGTGDPQHDYDAMACVNALRTENERLREALGHARDELSRWGWGDMHYGPQPQEKSVVEALRKINEALA